MAEAEITEKMAAVTVDDLPAPVKKDKKKKKVS